MSETTDRFKTLQSTVDLVVREMEKRQKREDTKAAADSVKATKVADKAKRAAASDAAIEADAEAKLKKRVRNITLTVLGTIATTGGGVLTWASVQPERPATIESSDVQAEVKSKAHEITGRVDDVEGAVDDLRDVVVDQQIDLEAMEVQQFEGFEYIGELIQTPARNRGDVEVPESLKAAKRRERGDAVRDRLFGE